MSDDLPFALLEDPGQLAAYQGWAKEVYEDLLALDRGTLSQREFDARYVYTRSILVLDLTGFTNTAMHGGAVRSFMRILDAQKICIPVLRQHGAGFIRTFADDIVGLFDTPGPALEAALEIHRRTELFVRSARRLDPAECCIGIGHGSVYAIGPNHAMGDEMNRASKLGEDTARGGETLVTERAWEILSERNDVRFELQSSDDLIFPYYRVVS